MIHVLPADEAARDVAFNAADPGNDPLAWAAKRRFTPSGRAALDMILRSLTLDPADDVLITNASGQTYISPCVTCIVFNHCRPSRVMTDRTKAIVVVHEFGYPHPELHELVAEAQARGIPLIEDCAHSFDSTLDGAPLGSFGDYALFSLPKVLPVRAGGILVARAALPDGTSDPAAEGVYREHLRFLADYARRRRANYASVDASRPDLARFLAGSDGVTPFYIGLRTPMAREVRRRSDAIEWGSTLEDDLLLVTTNPFVEPDELVAALDSALEAA